METYSQRDMEKAELNYTFVQDNQSMSTKCVLRRPHFQIDYPQTKLDLVINDFVFDVVFALRADSKKYGKMLLR